MTTSTNNFDQLHEEFNTKTDDHAARQAEFLKLKTFILSWLPWMWWGNVY